MNASILKNKINRLLKSPVFLLILLLSAADLYLVFKFNHSQSSKGDLASNESRIPAIKYSIENGSKADVLILGSSLTVTAFTYPDFEHGLSPMKNLDDQYVQARFLSKLIEEENGKSFDTVNLSCLAATPADELMLVDQLSKRNKLPSTIIYGIEPRAIADNLTPVGGALGGTAALELKPYYVNPNLVQCLEISTHNIASVLMPAFMKESIKELGVKLARLGEGASQSDRNEIVASHCWHLFGARKAIGNAMQELAIRVFKPKSASPTETLVKTSDTCLTKVECIATDRIIPVSHDQEKPWRTVSQARIEKQLTQYKFHYLPANAAKLEKNLEILQKLAALCKQNGSKLYIVKMPITRANLALVPASTSKSYDASLDLVAQKFGCCIVDLRDGFDQADFMDTVHLNAQGGEKLQRKLVSAIAASVQ
jgi:hypothetical protein